MALEYLCYRAVKLLLACFAVSIFCLKAQDIGVRNMGFARLVGSVISTPCSIVLSKRDQIINFPSVRLITLSKAQYRDFRTKPFEIELRDCGNLEASLDSKTWKIKFNGPEAEGIDAFSLQGPSYGLGISILDNEKKKVIPGKSYPLVNSLIRGGKNRQSLFLRFFLQLELTGQSFQAGSYKGVVRFLIDYE